MTDFPIDFNADMPGIEREVERIMNLWIEAGVTIVKIKIVLEHKDNVLWLPPDAIRAFEGRRFVVVREGERERRVTVKTGIETDDKVEILDGLKAGDVVVGQ